MKVEEFNNLALICEFMLLFFQVIYVLEDPNDKPRILHLVFICFQTLHSSCNELFIIDKVPLTQMGKSMLVYVSGISLSMYFVYYFFKISDLRSLKFLSTSGPFLFQLLPFIVTFLIPYAHTGDLDASVKIGITIPFLYSLAFAGVTSYSLYRLLQSSTQITGHIPVYRLLPYYVALLCWSALHPVVFSKNFACIESVVTNACFLLISIYYMISVVENARAQNRRINQMQEMDRAHTKAIIYFTHDTKTPLTFVSNFLLDIQDQYGGTMDHKEQMDAVLSNVRRLSSSLQNLGDSARMGTDLYDHNQVSDLSAIVNRSVILFKIIAQRRGIELVEETRPGLITKAHPEALERLVNNLVENAIRYTPKGGKIETKLVPVYGKIHFSVRDTGIGIPSELHQKIFEPYFQIPTNGRTREGLGIGLAIVQKIVTDLQGRIELESVPKKGTTIRLIFDRHFLQKGERHSKSIDPYLINTYRGEQQVNRTIDPEKPCILLVEDNDDMRNYLGVHLEKKFNLMVAESGQDALERLSHIPRLDLIISDIVMAGMDGIQFCTMVSKLPKFNHIPFIFLTAYGDNRAEGFSLGAIDFIEKPFIVKDLVRKIESILGNLKKQREALVTRAYNDMLTSAPVVTDPPAMASDTFEGNCQKYGLTAREIQVASLLITGLPYKLIADQMDISVKTVANHITNIFEKTGAQSKIELLRKLGYQTDRPVEG